MKAQQRYAVTIGAVLLYYLLSFVTLFYYPDHLSLYERRPTIGLFALGLSPIYGGFVLVEIISYVIQPFKKWRTQGIEGRKKIHRVQLALMICMAAFQGWGTGHLVNSQDPNYSLAIFGTSGLLSQIILCAGLTVGVLIFYAIASGVTRFGLFNGFILFFFIRPLIAKAIALTKEIQSDLRLYQLGVTHPDLTFGIHFSSLDQKMDIIYFLLAMIGIGFLIFQSRKKIMDFINYYLLRRPVVNYQAQEKTYQVKASPVPQTITGGIGFLLLIVQLVWFRNGISSSDEIWRILIWVGADMIDLVVTSYLLWLLFTNSYWINYHLESRATWVPDRTKLKPYFYFWLVVSTLAGFLNESFSFSNSSLVLWNLGKIVFEPIFILTTVILGLELIEKWKFERKATQSVFLAEMDNVEMVQLWFCQLEEANITFHAEGLRYRQLTQFFAPYLKMRLFVDERNAEEAANIIRLEEVKQI